MYRIKYLLGSLLAAFSVLYFIFGVAGWMHASSADTDILVSFLLGTIHVAGGSWLLLSSMVERKREKRRLDHVIAQLIEANGGRVVVSDVARYADVTEDDAREYLDRRAAHEVSYLHRGRNGRDLYYFGQRFWNN